MATNNLTLLTTGGTIGSTNETDSVDVSQGQQQLHDHIQSICQQRNISLATQAVFNKNSEDLTPTDWLALINAIDQLIAEGCEQIIVTHGTDTMAYTAAAIALCFRSRPVKIVFTGSCFTLDHPDSDVTANLLGAFAAATEPKIAAGVYVSFLNAEKQVTVMDALDVKPIAFDELVFRAVYGQNLGTFNHDLSVFTENNTRQPSPPLSVSIDPERLEPDALENTSLHPSQLTCYPGMDALPLCAGLKKGRCVIISLYHSGTGPSLAQGNSLIEVIRSRPDLNFLLTTLPSRYISKPYTATATLMQAGARVYRDIQPHQLQVLMTLGLSSGQSTEELLQQLNPLQQAPTES